MTHYEQNVFSETHVRQVKKVCFCADDFALNTSISYAILKLLAMHRLNAVSCMTQSPDWDIWGPQLLVYKNDVDIGLHFNLTHYFPYVNQVQHSSLKQLMINAWLRKLDKKRIYQELQNQWDRFVAVMGFVPDFIDGHQHIHQFPIIRDVLIDFAAKNQFNGWVRSLSGTIVTPSEHRIKSILLPWLGSKSLAALCQKFNIKTNDQFAGIYDFSNPFNYQELVCHWLSRVSQSAVVMCHPAFSNEPSSDVIALARYQEYLYLSSDTFIQDYKDNQVMLARIGVK